MSDNIVDKYISFLNGKKNLSGKDILDKNFENNLRSELNIYLSENKRKEFQEIYTQAFIILKLFEEDIKNTEKDNFIYEYILKNKIEEKEIENILMKIKIKKLNNKKNFEDNIEYLINIIYYKKYPNDKLRKHIEKYYFDNIIQYKKMINSMNNKYSKQIKDNGSTFQEIVLSILNIFRKHLKEKNINKIFEEYSYNYFYKIFDNEYKKYIKEEYNKSLYLEDLNNEENPDKSNKIISDYYEINKKNNDYDEENIFEFENNYYDFITKEYIEIRTIIYSYINIFMKNKDIANSFACSEATVTNISNKLKLYFSYSLINKIEDLFNDDNLNNEQLEEIKKIFEKYQNNFDKFSKKQIGEELENINPKIKNIDLIIEKIDNFKRVKYIKTFCKNKNISHNEFTNIILNIQNNYDNFWKNYNVFRKNLKLEIVNITDDEIKELYYFGDKITEYIFDDEISINFIKNYREYFNLFSEEFLNLISPCNIIHFSNILNYPYNKFYNLDKSYQREYIFSFFSSKNRKFNISENTDTWEYKSFIKNKDIKVTYNIKEKKLEINDLF